MSQTTQPRSIGQDLKLIHKAIRRIAKHPDVLIKVGALMKIEAEACESRIEITRPIAK